MHTIYRYIKKTLVGVILLITLFYGLLYVLLSIDSIQQQVKDKVVYELSGILKTDLSIGQVHIRPFNKLTLENVLIPDQNQDTLFYASKISAGFQWSPLLKKSLSFTTVQLLGFDVNLNRPAAHEPLNIQFIIDAFASQDTVKRQFPFKLHFNSIFLRRGSFRYDVTSLPHRPARFDKNHVKIDEISAALSLRAYAADTLNLQLKRLSFKEQSGLNLKRLTFEVEGNGQSATVNDFLLQLPQSTITIDSLSTDLRDVHGAKEFADSAVIHLELGPSHVSLQDISAFVPSLRYFTTPAEVKIQAFGPINQMEIPLLSIYSENEISLDARASLTGITRPSEAFIFGEVNHLEATPAGLMMLVNNFSPTFIETPPFVNRLGTVNFNGNISGFFSNLVAYGNLQTRMGNISTDILLGKDFDNHRFTCKGKVRTAGLNTAILFDKKADLLNHLAFSLKLDLDKRANKPIFGSLSGSITDFDLKGYSYGNLTMNGSFVGKSFDGLILLDDPNGQVEITGKMSIDKRNTMFNLTADLNQVRPGAMKLLPKYPTSEVSLKLNANFTGNNFDNAQGRIEMDSLIISNEGETFKQDWLYINALNNKDPQVIQLNSDLIKAQIRGRYAFAQLLKELRTTIGTALPVILPKQKYTSQPINDFDFALQIGETTQLQKVLKLPVNFDQPVNVSGFYNSHKGLIRLAGEFPKFKIGKMNFEDGNFLADMPNDQMIVRFSTIRLDKNNNPLALALNARANEGELSTRFDWSNLKETTYSGSFGTNITFKQRNDSKYPLRTNIEVLPSNLIFNDSIWLLHPASAVIDSGRVEINDFTISHALQHLNIDGAFSKRPSDTLRLNLQDMSLDFIFQTLNKNFIMFGGEGTGEFLVSNENNVPVIRTDSLKVKNFSYNNELLGDLKLYSDWDAKNNGITLKGDITQPDARPTHIDGGIYLKQDSLWLNFKANRLNIGFVDMWTNKILKGLQGRASGDVTLYGKFKAINLVGEAWGENVSFGIDYLNTVYSITDSIHFYTDGIAFNNVKVYDKNFTQAFANGRINYQNFKDITYDISFLIPQGRPFQVFNVTEKINPVYWGTIFASGTARIFGTTSKTQIDVSARSSANSSFFFSLNDNMTAGDYQFITFRNADDVWRNMRDSSATTIRTAPLPVPVEQKHDLSINLQMEATPDVTITLIMDPATGDQIKGTGSGNMRLEYNPTSDFKLYGGYTIDKGSYYFNLQDVFMRDFTIKQGSRVNFRGDPLNAELNIQAIYQVTANLTELDETFAQSRELSRPTVPVQCLLNIKGDLRRPDLSFDINLPTVSEDIDRQVKNLISTEDMMNRQILYLMVLNKFYTPDYVNSSQQNRYNELSSVASSTLSSQLNNLLGQISDNWNIGTNIRSDKGDFSDVEVELALSSQLLNNRLLFNGNLGYRDNPNANNSFIGDFDLEYLINPSGSWRLKAYNHYNDRNYSVKSALTTQGVGIMFKKDFNSLSTLFNQFLINTRLKKPKKQ